VPRADAEAKAQASGKAFGDARPAGKVWFKKNQTKTLSEIPCFRGKKK
jgi:hypothetical protein